MNFLVQEWFDITIEDPVWETKFFLAVQPEHSIQDLKNVITEKTGYKLGNLTIHGEPCINNKTLKEQGIKPNSVLLDFGDDQKTVSEYLGF